MRRTRAAAVAATSAMLIVAGCAMDEPASDELHDFVEPSSSTLAAGTPYDTYVMIVDRAGLSFLPFAEAEQRAMALCADPITAATDGDDAVSDLALLQSYCPEAVEPD